MLPSLIIQDDFLADPMAARRAALALLDAPLEKHGNYPGLMSSAPLAIADLDEAAARLIGRKVVAQPGTMHGHVRATLAGDKGLSGVHIDPCFYSGILYLSLPEHCRGGTQFFRHRRTGLERVPDDISAIGRAGYNDINDLIEDVVNRDTLKPSQWERVMTVPMRFNRLILFSPWLFHNSGPGFGKSKDDARLVHLSFFAAA